MARLVARFGLTRFDADEYYKLALKAFQKNNLAEAILNMNHALNLLPYRAEYYAARGFFHLEDGVIEKAAEDFDQALQISKYEMLANYGKGVIAYKDKDWEGASQYFLAAWAAAPDRAETLYYLAMVAYRLRDYERAADWMQRAIKAYGQRGEKKHITNAQDWLNEFKKQSTRNNLLNDR
ncbi:tetratricopeptide repeat protein [Phototrophicus methaneseepsis]|uniref:Tetratricopeptide repeat protein n=1 Tax=Phototrophicus methaneseepsis TaxID=2710758 RepID=A0A7S8EDD3_9CHLR|nr:tetratricopeptide repeat protein [Phototrophicus methaneseepsis]QPC84905.1 tetratricopeptide repeat protein [Phototrophicus methaneseepsis]